MSAADRLREIMDQRIAIHDGSWGVLIHRKRLSEADYRGALLARPRPRRPGRSRSAEPHAAGAHLRDPRRVLRRGRGHRDDEHLHGDVDRAGRLRARGPRRRDEPRGRAARARGGRRVDGAHARPAALRRGRDRAAQRLALRLAEGRRRRASARSRSTRCARATPSRSPRSRRAASTSSSSRRSSTR